MANFMFATATFLCAMLHSVAFLKGSVGIDTLFPNQTIAVGQILVSQSQIFELGFFSPGKSRCIFLGIWYKTTPDVVVWVANRNNPITNSQRAIFTVAGNGTLVIRSGRRVIRSEYSSRAASNPALQLLDTGNLVLLDKMNGDLIWQSFDHPSDTWLPGMKMVDDIDPRQQRYLTSWKNANDPSPGNFCFRIENMGMPQMVLFNGSVKIFRTGTWNGIHFSGVIPFPHVIFNPELVFGEESRLVSVMERCNSTALIRLILDASGLLQRLIINSRKDTWNHMRIPPANPCYEYGQCGPNAVCTSDRLVMCECFKGFEPNFKRDWELQEWTRGCKRTMPLNCEGDDDGFVDVRQAMYPDMLWYWLNNTMTLKECRKECLGNCSCTAYASQYISDGGRGCLMWFGELIDIRDNPAADNKQVFYIRLSALEISKSFYSITSVKKEKEKEKEKKTSIKIILISAAIGVLVSGFVHVGIVLMTRQKKQAAKRYSEDLDLPMFKWATIVAATNSFSRENIIGEGGFGPVYKGTSVEKEIAVKRLSKTSVQGLEEFKNEVTLIAKLQHRNLVRLLGCCIEGEERLLIYEYMQNGSLDYFVFDQNRRTLLTWPKRFDIIMGIARGLLYLHHDSRLKIIHRDLKTSNILLDENLNPKISDFGLARTFGEDQSIARTKRVVGTHGYMAPEYALDGKISMKSDIFSVGVVLLEIVSGKKNRGFHHCDHYYTLLGHAWWLWKENRILELMDECLKDTFIESQVKRCSQVGLLCVQKFAEDRPDISSVLFMLGTDGAIVPEPKEPGFFTERSSSPVISDDASPGTESEKGTMTITDLEAR